MPQTARASAAHALQTSAYLAHRQSVATNPRKDPTYDLGLIFDDLEAGRSATLSAADVAIAEGRGGQCTDCARARSMQTTPPNPLQYLAALVLGDDALNLQQQIVLRRVADRAVEEYDPRPAAVKLLDQQDLMGVLACQPVWRQHIDALDIAGGHRVAQLLQRQPLKIAAAATIIHVAVMRLELKAVGRDTLR
jgi:hypothetical protein